MSDFNASIIEEFRTNEGKVGGMFSGAPLLILHTTGARTGAKREHPLMYLEDDGRLFVFASKAGADTHPAWYHNVIAHPEVGVEIGTELAERRAVEILGDERDAIYAAQSTSWPQFDGYQQATSRVIPVIELV